jgi:hypothetical protein
MQLVTKSWETSQNLVSFEKKANGLLEQLETNLKNEYFFCDQVLAPFSKYVDNTSTLKRIQEKLPSLKRTKNVKSCWQNKVGNLQLIVKSCKQVISEKEDLLTSLLQMDLSRTTSEVQDPKLILKSLSVTKESFKEQVDILKGLSFEKFYSILEHRLDEHERWVLDYASHNEAIEQTLHNISMDLRKLENDLCNIEIWDETNTAPMKRYIKEWFQERMDDLIQEGQEPVNRTTMLIDDNNTNASDS